ncbi:hypothetical protein [Cricetibacter osteomyelitidis]|nr:hypothetical protein [Cricetibacter osteomyelitidis]
MNQQIKMQLTTSNKAKTDRTFLLQSDIRRLCKAVFGYNQSR